MPKVVILRSWPNDDDLQVLIEVDRAYPDELAQAARVALDTYREAIDVTLNADSDDEEQT